MAQHGGYRKPENPAQVSGPGALSQRTDGSPQAQVHPTGGKYGEAKTYSELSAGAAAGAPPIAGGGASGDTPTPPTPLDAPTENPNEPVTAGADAGEGPDSSVLNLPKQETQADLKAKFGPILPALIAEAQSPYATQALKDRVQALIAAMS